MRPKSLLARGLACDYGLMKIELLEAKNLRGRSESDHGSNQMVYWICRHIDPYPYMVWNVDDEVKDKTKVVKKSKNPVWNRVAYIPITEFDYNHGEFMFKVLDYTVARP